MLLSFWGSPQMPWMGPTGGSHGLTEGFWGHHFGEPVLSHSILSYIYIYLYYSLFNSPNVIKLNMNPKCGWTWGLEDVFPWFSLFFFEYCHFGGCMFTRGLLTFSIQPANFGAYDHHVHFFSAIGIFGPGSEDLPPEPAPGCHWKNGGFWLGGSALGIPKDCREKRLWHVVKRFFDDIHMNKGIYIYIIYIKG